VYTETRISLAIVLVPAEKEQPGISQKLRENRHTHYLLSSIISRTEKTKEERTVGTPGNKESKRKETKARGGSVVVQHSAPSSLATPRCTR